MHRYAFALLVLLVGCSGGSDSASSGVTAQQIEGRWEGGFTQSHPVPSSGTLTIDLSAHTAGTFSGPWVFSAPLNVTANHLGSVDANGNAEIGIGPGSWIVGTFNVAAGIASGEFSFGGGNVVGFWSADRVP